MKIIQFSVLLVILISVLCITTILAQDVRDPEQSNVPQNVLRKYKIRRTKTIDANGNTVITSQRVRRIRPNTNLRKLNQGDGNLQQLNAEPLVREQLISSNDQAEPIRVVPNTSRKQTSSQERAKLLGNVKLRGRNEVSKPKFGNSAGATQSYSHTNPDGSFTFGYEGGDGSFKEETRGTDCIVRGKYGYIDPDGIRREFAYTSGNSCDPTEKSIDSDEDENSIPEKSSGIKVLRPRKPLLRRPITGFLEERFMTQQDQTEIIITPPPPPTSAPLLQSTVSYGPKPRTRQRIRRPKPTVAAAALTAGPVSLVQKSLDEQAALKNNLPIVIPAASPVPNRQNRGYNFDQEVQGIQSTLSRGGSRIRNSDRQRNPGNYRTELIFDPQTQQYTSVLLQNTPGSHNPLSDSLVYNQQLPPQSQQPRNIPVDPVYMQQKQYYEAQEYLRRREAGLGHPTPFPQFHRQAGIIAGF